MACGQAGGCGQGCRKGRRVGAGRAEVRGMRNVVMAAVVVFVAAVAVAGGGRGGTGGTGGMGAWGHGGMGAWVGVGGGGRDGVVRVRLARTRPRGHGKQGAASAPGLETEEV